MQKWFWYLLCKDSLELPEMLEGTNTLMFLEYYFPLRYYLPYLFLKKFRGTAYIQMINFQDLIHKSDFDIYKMIFNIPQKL